jgi:hypothetical protein
MFCPAHVCGRWHAPRRWEWRGERESPPLDAGEEAALPSFTLVIRPISSRSKRMTGKNGGGQVGRREAGMRQQNGLARRESGKEGGRRGHEERMGEGKCPKDTCARTLKTAGCAAMRIEEGRSRTRTRRTQERACARAWRRRSSRALGVIRGGARRRSGRGKKYTRPLKRRARKRSHRIDVSETQTRHRAERAA